MRRNKRFAFSLVEVVVAVALLSMVGVGFVRALSAGIDFWDRIRAEHSAGDLAMVCQRLHDDLANYAPFDEGSLELSGNKLAFYIFGFFSDKERIHAMLKVEYSFDPSTHGVYRTVYLLGEDKPFYRVELTRKLQDIRFGAVVRNAVGLCQEIESFSGNDAVMLFLRGSFRSMSGKIVEEKIMFAPPIGRF